MPETLSQRMIRMQELQLRSTMLLLAMLSKATCDNGEYHYHEILRLALVNDCKALKLDVPA